MSQTLGALAVGMALVASVSITISILLPVLLPILAPHSQAVHFLFCFTVLAIVLTGIMTGGYLTARLSRQSETRNALILGAVAPMTALLWLRMGAPAWFVEPIFHLSIPSAWIGGHLRTRQKAGALLVTRKV